MIFRMIRSWVRYHKHCPVAVTGVLLAMSVLSACKHKSRLNHSTYSFTVSPTAASVLINQTLTLTATAVSASGPVAINPTWTISNTSGTIGSLNTDIGTVVVFSAVGLGDVNVTASFEDVSAVSQIAVEAYIPVSSAFNIYTDQGIPPNSTLFASPGATLEQLSVGYTPEGIYYMRDVGAMTGGFWGVSIPVQNLSTYAGGSLLFSLRLGRALDNTEAIEIDIKDSAGGVSRTSSNSFQSFLNYSTDWQDLSIPLSGAFGSIDPTRVQVPFAVIMTSLDGPLTFDIDAVRWTGAQSAQALRLRSRKK
jgi:hypothetical protein